MTGGLSQRQRALKRALDVAIAGGGLSLTWWLIALAWVAMRIDTGLDGLFVQERVGRDGRRFTVVKIRTMRAMPGYETTLTVGSDPRITRLGALLRRTKIDELPQLWNVLVGDMSIVGPRPAIPGFADELQGDDRIILTVRPGITGPASLKYRREEEILRDQPDPERYNIEVIFPDKIALNRAYVLEYRLVNDLRYILKTLVGG